MYHIRRQTSYAIISVRGNLTSPRKSTVQFDRDGTTEDRTVLNCTVVVNHLFRKPDSDKYEEEPEFFEFAIWGDLADKAIERGWPQKGTEVEVSGRLLLDHWINEGGEVVIRKRIVAPSAGHLTISYRVKNTSSRDNPDSDNDDADDGSGSDSSDGENDGNTKTDKSEFKRPPKPTR